jgi:hypothetical protein
MGTPEGPQKSINSASILQKKTKASYGIYTTEFTGSIETRNQPIETKKFSKKYV